MFPVAWQTWILTPVDVEGTFTQSSQSLSETLGSDIPPLYNAAGKDKIQARLQATTPATTGSDGCNNSLPPYGQETCCSCSHHSTETKDDEELCTMVTEVTTVTTTTRKKYRVTDESNVATSSLTRDRRVVSENVWLGSAER